MKPKPTSPCLVARVAAVRPVKIASLRNSLGTTSKILFNPFRSPLDALTAAFLIAPPMLPRKSEPKASTTRSSRPLRFCVNPLATSSTSFNTGDPSLPTFSALSCASAPYNCLISLSSASAYGPVFDFLALQTARRSRSIRSKVGNFFGFVTRS